MQQAAAARDLEHALAHRRWVRRARPFPHVLATDVFTDEVYAGLEADFERIMGSGAISHDTTAGYEAKSARLADHADGPLGLFLSREWHDLVAGVTGIAHPTGDVSAALHHHRPGGAAGWPHHDLNPGWFGGPSPQPHEVRHERIDAVDYHHGPPEGVGGRETVRAASVLFYLANPEWSEGDGGETGLYAGAEAGTRRDGWLVPPRNNSLVVFECTPFSWHGYAGGSRHLRNCLVMWIHRPKDEVVAQWGESSIAYW